MSTVTEQGSVYNWIATGVHRAHGMCCPEGELEEMEQLQTFLDERILPLLVTDRELSQAEARRQLFVDGRVSHGMMGYPIIGNHSDEVHLRLVRHGTEGWLVSASCNTRYYQGGLGEALRRIGSDARVDDESLELLPAEWRHGSFFNNFSTFAFLVPNNEWLHTCLFLLKLGFRRAR